MVGNLFYAGCQWIMLSMVAKLGSTEMIGEYALALAITSPVFLFLSLKLRAVQASDARSEFEFGHYFGLRLLTLPIALLLVTMIIVIGFPSHQGEVIAALALSKTVEGISDAIYGRFQQLELMHLTAISQIMKGTVGLLALTVTLMATDDLVLALTAMSAGWAIVCVGFDIPRAIDTSSESSKSNWLHGLGIWGPAAPIAQWERMYALTRMALPLGMTIALGSLETVIPRYFVAHSLSTKELGIFAGLTYVTVAGGLVINALGQSATPRLSQLFQSGNVAQFRRLLFQLVAAGIAIGLAGILLAMIIGDHVLTLMYNDDFSGQRENFSLVMLVAAFGYAYVFLGTACNAMRTFRVQLPIHLTSLAILTALSFLLVEPYGLKGAIFAMLGGVFVATVLYVKVVQRNIAFLNTPYIRNEEVST